MLDSVGACGLLRRFLVLVIHACSGREGKRERARAWTMIAENPVKAGIGIGGGTTETLEFSSFAGRLG